jgi:hypothetical protein
MKRNLEYQLYKGAGRPSPSHSGRRGRRRRGRGAPASYLRLSKEKWGESEREKSGPSCASHASVRVTLALQIYNVSLGKKVTNLKRKEATTTTTIFIRLYKTALMIISNYQFWVLPKEEDKPARIMLP